MSYSWSDQYGGISVSIKKDITRLRICLRKKTKAKMVSCVKGAIDEMKKTAKWAREGEEELGIW